MIVDFISSSELAILLYHRFLQLVLIDIQSCADVSTTIYGSYVLQNLPQALDAHSDKGSVIFSFCTDEQLSNLLTTLEPPILVFFDTDGNENCRKVLNFFNQAVALSTESKAFKAIRHVRVLSGGYREFSRQFPKLCINERKEFVRLMPSERARSLSEQQLYDPPSLIIPNLYLGGIFGTDLQTIKQIKYHHLVSVGEMPLIVSDLDLNLKYSPLISPSTRVQLDYAARSIIQIPLDAYQPPNYSPMVLFNKDDSKLRVHVDVASQQGLHPITHYMFTLEDVSHAPIDLIFKQSSKLISQALDNHEMVFVHCHGGVSRSATLVIAYLISSGLSLAEAFSLVYHSRSCIKPNDGFWKKLMTLEMQLGYNVKIPDNLRNVVSENGFVGSLMKTCSLTLLQMKNTRRERVEMWLNIRKRFHVN